MGLGILSWRHVEYFYQIYVRCICGRVGFHDILFNEKYEKLLTGTSPTARKILAQSMKHEKDHIKAYIFNLVGKNYISLEDNH